MSRPPRSRLAVLSAVACLSLVAACGGSDAETASAGSEADSELVAQAKAAVEQNRQGTDRALPESGPAPLSDQNIWVISCTEAGEGCSAPAAGAKDAGEQLGWDVTVFDGKGTPDVFAQGIRTAIADQADGIILDVVDCVAAKAPLEEAKAAGVKIFAFYSLDCDDPLLGGGEPLFDAEILYEEGMTYAEQVEDVYSKSVADYVIAETEGNAKIIQFIEDDILVGQHLYKGFEKHIEPCGGCEIVKQIPFTLTDLVTGQLQGKAAAALTQHPDANVMYVPYDAALTLGIAQAVTASGRDADMLVTGGEGLSPNLGFVREGKGQDMIAGAPARWVGWAAIDGMNRLLQGEEQVDAGIGMQTLDSESTLPTETSFYDGNVDADGKPTQDYEANYRTIWGLS
ncbi:monosaccharide ABC transporter substrate-binding protein (CUT2 family) [Blastococcus colisei]|uniref:Monosaccharide ABC transporter substrate-binding protein (CUT2 family) n=1 Tax=Blastococcus colisei TaxID=1564162 RepID=A0A543PAL2_9ACTN|nr:substrate-binding domain-containing protein [Blastococcus colisei]TQN41121.1 monosaccharide ABC transporter substrate-binding protein (CUT2 family) [Blastococcus colisei]